jgi:hypothetical protein
VFNSSEGDGDVDVLGRFSSNMMNELRTHGYFLQTLVDSTQVINIDQSSGGLG